MINRIISKEILETRKSILLLGPRQVGKSTLMESLKPDLTINLSDELEFLRFSSRPEEFRSLIENSGARLIYVDEIQRLPKLLNTIQVIVDKDKKLRFLLTGSSARKLKRGEANLLPGRVINFNLGPLSSCELSYLMDTKKALTYGTLPEIYLSKNDKENQLILRTYSATYLREEIKAEALVRNLDSFARFFNEVVKFVSEFVDYTKLSQYSKISRHAIPRYFEILEDTLVGHRVFPFQEVPKHVDLIKHPKFYFFDNGVYNGLLGNYVASQDRIGKLSEQLVFSQMMHSAWAQNAVCNISTFRERSGVEVDFITKVDGVLNAIEVKTSEHVSSSDLLGLKYFDETIQVKKNLFVFHFGRKEQKLKNIWILPWQKGLKEMGL